eukprot:5940164-Amphidinium_carterae.2
MPQVHACALLPQHENSGQRFICRACAGDAAALDLMTLSEGNTGNLGSSCVGPCRHRTSTSVK